MTDHATLHGALAAVQSDLPDVHKAATADTGKFTYTYATLTDVNAAVLPVLAAAGLAWTCTLTGDGTLLGRLTHAGSGEHVDSVWPLPSTADPQALGSSITYGRRYLLCALVGVAPDEDDDGATAKHAAERRADREHVEAGELMAASALVAEHVPAGHYDALLNAYHPGAPNLGGLPRPALQRLIRALSDERLRRRLLDGLAATVDGDDAEDWSGLPTVVGRYYGDLSVVQVTELVKHGATTVTRDDADDVVVDLSRRDVPDRARIVRSLEANRDDGPRRTIVALVDRVLDPQPGDDPSTVRVPRDG